MTTTIIKSVMSSAAEAKLDALFINANKAVHIQNILTKKGHPHPCTPIQTNHTTAEGGINNCIQPKQLKAMDMRLHWLKDCEAQEQFRIHWRPEKSNLEDYWTRHHAPAHHKNIRAEFLTKIKDLAEARQLQKAQGQTIKTLATRVC
jgi:hypothetical protein